MAPYTPAPFAPQAPKIPGTQKMQFGQAFQPTPKPVNLPKPKSIIPPQAQVSTGALAPTTPTVPMASMAPLAPQVTKPKANSTETIKFFYDNIDEKDPKDRQKLNDIAQLKTEMDAENMWFEDQKQVISNYLLKNVAQDLKTWAIKNLQETLKNRAQNTYQTGIVGSSKDFLAKKGAINNGMVDLRKIYDPAQLSPAESFFLNNAKPEEFMVPIDQVDQILEAGKTEGEANQGILQSAFKWAVNIGGGALQGANQAVIGGAGIATKIGALPLAGISGGIKNLGEAIGSPTLQNIGQAGENFANAPANAIGNIAKYNTSNAEKNFDTENINYQGWELAGNLITTAPINLGGSTIAKGLGDTISKTWVPWAKTLGKMTGSKISQIATENALQNALATQLGSVWTTGELASASDTAKSAGIGTITLAGLYAGGKILGKGLQAVSETAPKVKAMLPSVPFINKTPEKTIAKNLERLKEVSISWKAKKVLANAEKKWFNPMEDVAKYDNYKPDIVDGKIDSERVIWEIHEQAGKQADLLSKALKQEGKTVSVQSVYDDMIKNVTKGLDDSKDLADGIARADKFKALLERKAVNGEISLSDLANIKKRAYADINYLADPSWSVDTDKAIARTFKEAVENGSSSLDVKALNEEIARQYAIADYLGSINTRAMKGGRLGTMAARATGNIAGSTLWPFGSLIGGEIAAKIQKSLIANSIWATKNIAPESQLFKTLASDVASGKIGANKVSLPKPSGVLPTISTSKLPTESVPLPTETVPTKSIKLPKTKKATSPPEVTASIAIPKTKTIKTAKETISLPKVKFDSVPSETKTESKTKNIIPKKERIQEALDIWEQIYHGTNSKFDSLDNSFRWKNESDYPAKNAFFFTDSLDTAKSYWKNIIKANKNFKKPLEIDADGATYADFRDEMRDAIEKAQKGWNDVVIIKNLSDRKDWWTYEPTTHYAVIDTNSIVISKKSKNTKF